MAQIQKDDVRQRILRSANRLFENRSYAATTLAAIAKDSGVSVGNIYVYFKSKVDLFFAVYAPWFMEQQRQIESAGMRIQNLDKRLAYILKALWYQIPSKRHGFANNLAQALSMATPADRNVDLYLWSSDRLAAMIRHCLPPDRRAIVTGSALANILLMAHVGFSINYKFGVPVDGEGTASELMRDLLRGNSIKSADIGSSSMPRGRDHPASRRAKRVELSQIRKN